MNENPVYKYFNIDSIHLGDICDGMTNGLYGRYLYAGEEDIEVEVETFIVSYEIETFPEAFVFRSSLSEDRSANIREDQQGKFQVIVVVSAFDVDFRTKWWKKTQYPFIVWTKVVFASTEVMDRFERAMTLGQTTR